MVWSSPAVAVVDRVRRPPTNGFCEAPVAGFRRTRPRPRRTRPRSGLECPLVRAMAGFRRTRPHRGLECPLVRAMAGFRRTRPHRGLECPLVRAMAESRRTRPSPARLSSCPAYPEDVSPPPSVRTAPSRTRRRYRHEPLVTRSQSPCCATPSCRTFSRAALEVSGDRRCLRLAVASAAEWCDEGLEVGASAVAVFERLHPTSRDRPIPVARARDRSRHCCHRVGVPAEADAEP